MVEIRKANVSDVPHLMDLRRLFVQTLMELRPERFQQSRNDQTYFRKRILELIDSDSSIVLVAVKRTKVVGFAYGYVVDEPTFSKHKQIGLLNKCVVKDDYRKEGIGTRLVNEMVDFFRKRRIPRVEFTAEANNLGALKAWKKLGFIEERVTMGKNLIDPYD